MVAAASLVFDTGVQDHRADVLGCPPAELASEIAWDVTVVRFTVSSVYRLSRRAVPAAAGAVGMLRAPGVDHRHDVTERASAVLALVGTALAAVVCNMLAAAGAVRMLGTPGVQQRAQRMVLRAAIDAEVFAALTALEQRVLAAAGSTWMLRAPAVQ